MNKEDYYHYESLARGWYLAMLKKVIKVPMPVRGVDIDITNCFDLVETKVFQRLRGIRQMGTVHLVFPGATHTRFEHSLGALFFSRRIANVVGLCEYDRKLVEIAALLHDVAHGRTLMYRRPCYRTSLRLITIKRF